MCMADAIVSISTPRDVQIVADVLATFGRCGTPGVELQSARACKCGGSPPCYIQLKDVATRLETADGDCYARLCMDGRVQNTRLLGDAVRQVIGCSVRTSGGVSVPGTTNKRSPIYGLSLTTVSCKRTRDGTAAPPIQTAVALIEVRSIARDYVPSTCTDGACFRLSICR